MSQIASTAGMVGRGSWRTASYIASSWKVVAVLAVVYALTDPIPKAKELGANYWAKFSEATQAYAPHIAAAGVVIVAVSLLRAGARAKNGASNIASSWRSAKGDRALLRAAASDEATRKFRVDVLNSPSTTRTAQQFAANQAWHRQVGKFLGSHKRIEDQQDLLELRQSYLLGLVEAYQSYADDFDRLAQTAKSDVLRRLSELSVYANERARQIRAKHQDTMTAYAQVRAGKEQKPAINEMLSGAGIKVETKTA